MNFSLAPLDVAPAHGSGVFVGNGSGVGVGVEVGGTGVGVSVGSGVFVGVAVSVGVGVAVGVSVAVGIGVGVSVGCADSVAAATACSVDSKSAVGVLPQAVNRRLARIKNDERHFISNLPFRDHRSRLTIGFTSAASAGENLRYRTL